MSVIATAVETAKRRQARVVFPEAGTERIDAAMARMAREGICAPLPLAPASDAQVAAILAARGTKEALVRKMLARPLYRAAAMVAAGEADVMVAGAEHPTRRVIEAASMAIGLRDGVALPSSFFLMTFPDGREMVWADCAVNTYPDAAGLEAIARASVASAEALLGAARPALLSFSTGASGTGASVDLVRQVAEATGLPGPVQADAALNPAIAAHKGAGAGIGSAGIGAGDANVLIFPSLDAGNIAYKLAQELAGAEAIGPMLQGFAKPVCDLSRGASVEDIVKATALTVAMMP